MIQKIELIATSVEFRRFSIVYTVKRKKAMKIDHGLVLTHNSISDKDLILKTNFMDETFKVSFVPVNVTVEFYQKIFFDNKSKLSSEYRIERNDIYKVGDIIGYLLL